MSSEDSTKPVDGEFPDILNGRYRLMRELGRGGIGVVMLATDLMLKRQVAIKFLSMRFADKGIWRERFFREARATATLSNSNIVTIHDIGDYRGRIYLVMEYLDGGNLRDSLPTLRADEPLTHAIIKGICSGLAAAHRAGVVHRDIKSANILLGRAGEVKIADFGLARVAMDIDLTASGINVIGTPSYMSPEQVLGKDADRRSDVFSLGVVIYEVISGHLPFQNTSQHTLNEAILNLEPAPIEFGIASAHEHLTRVIARCLEKRPSRRYESAAEVLDDIMLLRSGPGTVAIDTIESLTGVSPPRAPESAIIRTSALTQHLAGLREFVRSNSSCCVVVRGNRGVGKTTLVRQLVEDSIGEGEHRESEGFKVFYCPTTTILGLMEFIQSTARKLEGLVPAKLIIQIEPLSSQGAVPESISAARVSLEALLKDTARSILFLESREPHDLTDFLVPSVVSVPLLARKNVDLGAPSREECVRILRQISDRRLANGQLRPSDDILEEIVNLTDAFVPTHGQPAKSILLLEQWLTYANSEQIAEDFSGAIAILHTLFARLVGIPRRLVSTESSMTEEEIGARLKARELANSCESKLVHNIFSRIKSRMLDHTKPLGSLMLLGPPGVGKLVAARSLSELFVGEGVVPTVIDFKCFGNCTAVDKAVYSTFHADEPQVISTTSLPRVRVFIVPNVHRCEGKLAELLAATLMSRPSSYHPEIASDLTLSFFIFTYEIPTGIARSLIDALGRVDLSSLGCQSRLRDHLIDYCPQLRAIWMLLDGIVAYGPLSDEQKEILLNRQIAGVLDRIGVAQRNLLVDLTDSARALLAEGAFSEAEGARNLRISVESALSLPLARLLASEPGLKDSIITLTAKGGEIFADVADVFSTEAGRDAKLVDSRRTIFLSAKPGEEDFISYFEEATLRIRELKQKFAYDESIQRTELLRQEMSDPVFWGQHNSHRDSLVELARLSKITDRVHSWESRLERIRASIEALNDQESVRGGVILPQLYGLLKDLDSASLEILLDGPDDREDAFVLVISKSQEQSDLRWLGELSRVYTGWARHRGYRFTLMGELDPDNEKCSGIVIHIAGINTFGLLKGEGGEHRKISTPRRSVGHHSSLARCQVFVLPDPDIRSSIGEKFDLQMRKLGDSARGIRINRPKRATRLVRLRDGAKLHLLTSPMVEDNRELYTDFFAQYLKSVYPALECRQAQRQDSTTNEIIRTFEDGMKSRVIDHLTKVVFENPRDYLSGKIDTLLLERLTT